jgi:hypothetical protein
VARDAGRRAGDGAGACLQLFEVARRQPQRKGRVASRLRSPLPVDVAIGRLPLVIGVDQQSRTRKGEKDGMISRNCWRS